MPTQDRPKRTRAAAGRAVKSRARRAPARPDPLERVRAICLSFPEGAEKEAWGTPTFRVRDKLIAMFTNNHHGDGRIALWIKAAPDAQEALVASNPERFFVPPYVGHKGWVGVRLEGSVDWGLVEELLKEGYRMTAPKRLLPLLGG